MDYSEHNGVFHLFQHLPSATSFNEATLLIIIYQKSSLSTSRWSIVNKCIYMEPIIPIKITIRAQGKTEILHPNSKDTNQINLHLVAEGQIKHFHKCFRRKSVPRKHVNRIISWLPSVLTGMQNNGDFKLNRLSAGSLDRTHRQLETLKYVILLYVYSCSSILRASQKKHWEILRLNLPAL